jgi:hypothetical protein
MKVIAEVDCYRGLLQALLARKDELDVSYETLDHVAGLPVRYSAKVLGARQRTLGPTSLGALLGALALKLAIVSDEEQLARIKHRLTRANWCTGKRADNRRKAREPAAALGQNATQDADAQRRALMSDLGRQSHAAWMARTTPEARQRQASRAATARWKAARRRLREAAVERRGRDEARC